MPIPLFTTGEKPSTTETLSPSQKETVTSTPLTSGSPTGSSDRRRPSMSAQEAVTASGAGTASSVASSGREQTREEREEAERLYEERIEDEYAKREGGA